MVSSFAKWLVINSSIASTADAVRLEIISSFIIDPSCSLATESFDFDTYATFPKTVHSIATLCQ